jgi:hypothetical protein
MKCRGIPQFNPNFKSQWDVEYPDGSKRLGSKHAAQFHYKGWRKPRKRVAIRITG